MTNYVNHWIVDKILELKIGFYGSRCAICQTVQVPEDLQFAHIRPTELSGRGRGRKERYYDVLNNLDCYRLMCAEGCHKLYDDELSEDPDDEI